MKSYVADADICKYLNFHEIYSKILKCIPERRAVTVQQLKLNALTCKRWNVQWNSQCFTMSFLHPFNSDWTRTNWRELTYIVTRDRNKWWCFSFGLKFSTSDSRQWKVKTREMVHNHFTWRLVHPVLRALTLSHGTKCKRIVVILQQRTRDVTGVLYVWDGLETAYIYVKIKQPTKTQNQVIHGRQTKITSSRSSRSGSGSSRGKLPL